MKKLFFAAALAIVAVGGAVSVNAITIYPAGSNQGYACEELATPTCLTNIPSGSVYTVPFSSNQQNSSTEVSREELADYQYLGLAD